MRFTHELSRWEPERSSRRVLIDWLRVAEVWVGENFLFGRDRTGTFTLLRALGEDRGFRTEKIDPVLYKDFVVSSTRVRRLLGEGRVDEAAALLGHHYMIDGTVVRGDGRGRELGVPTANLATATRCCRRTASTRPGPGRRGVAPGGDQRRRPADDRRRQADGRDVPARRAARTLRQPMRLAFVQWLREERKFEDLPALTAQMRLDCDDARAVLRT